MLRFPKFCPVHLSSACSLVGTLSASTLLRIPLQARTGAACRAACAFLPQRPIASWGCSGIHFRHLQRETRLFHQQSSRDSFSCQAVSVPSFVRYMSGLGVNEALSVERVPCAMQCDVPCAMRCAMCDAMRCAMCHAICDSCCMCHAPCAVCHVSSCRVVMPCRSICPALQGCAPPPVS